MADAVAEDGLGDDGLLVHDGLDHLGDVRGGDWSVNGDGVWLVNGHGVRLINGNGLGDRYGLRHRDQLNGLHGHRTEMSSVAETVASKAGWGGGAVAGKAETTVEEEAVSVAAEATAQTVTSQATVADEQSRVGDGQRDESGDDEEFHCD